MVASAASLHRPFLEHAPARSGFAGVEQLARKVRNKGGVAMALRGHGTESLHVVQKGTFCTQQIGQGTAHFGSHLTWHHTLAVLHHPGCPKAGIYRPKHGFRYVAAGKN